MRTPLPRLGYGIFTVATVGSAALGGLSCKEPMTSEPPAAGPSFVVQSVKVEAQVAPLLRAAIEMQHSGEPLAEAMGRSLAGYDRNLATPDQYLNPDTKMSELDLAGYSSAVESYEYSKLHMNAVSFELGAGVSLMYGPLVNSDGQGGAVGLSRLRGRVQALAIASRAGIDANGPWVIVPAPTDNALNRLGFPGLFPVLAEFRAFDPAVAPSGNVARKCTLSGGYGASAGMEVSVGDYECGYNSLHIDRSRADRTLDLEGLGLSAWKQALWAINYFQFVHDIDGAPKSHVADADLPQVGKPGNTVKADDNYPMSAGAPGTYLGSGSLEGFQGLLMTEALDNKAELLLKKLSTTDGTALSGFASTAAALSYDYTVPPRYFPHAVSVTEQPSSDGADPQPQAYAIPAATGGDNPGDSRLADLTALLGAYSEAFALTDRNNAEVGGFSTIRPVFDGDPFAQDNGMPDGEATLHDRALAVLKVALVNLDRLHVDAATSALCDRASVSGGTVTRSRHATTVDLARALVALRTVQRALSSQLTLYSNTTPDRAATATALDGTSLAGIPGGAKLADRIAQLIKAQADVLMNRLVDESGLAKNGYDLAASQPDASPTTLESQAEAIRGLLEAYLSTSNTSYRDRAQKAYEVLESRFHHPTLRIYRTTLGEDRSYTYTPVRVAALSAALRSVYQLLAMRAGQEALKQSVEQRIARFHKLVLNGWDDANQNGKVDYPGECLRVEAALPRGGMQVAERALTGELGSEMGALTADRDHDCVPEIDDAKLPALLASELVLTVREGTSP